MRLDHPERYRRKLTLAEEAVRQTPGDARLQSEAAYAHLSVYNEERMRFVEGQQSAPSVVATGPGVDAAVQLKRAHLVPALRHLLRSRDLCPVRAIAHLDIAAFVRDLEEAEPQTAYLQRVGFLAPAEPWFAYQCEIWRLADGRRGEAWADWRRSLTLSSDLLPQVLEQSRKQLDTPALLQHVLPDRPDLLMDVANGLPGGSKGERRVILERALAVLDHTSTPPTAEELHTRGIIRHDLGHAARALDDYRAALLLQPRRLSWRYERAQLLVEQGRFEDAHQEVLTILALEPANTPARALLDTVAQGLAEHR